MKNTTSNDKIIWDFIETGEETLALEMLGSLDDLTIRDKDGDTLLIQALRYGRDQIVEYLVSKMEDVTQVNHDGDHAFYYAIDYSSISVLERMIEKGADIDYCGPKGLTPFMLLATKDGQEEKMDFLIRIGVNLYIESPSGYNALACAYYSEKPNNVKKILEATNDVNDLFISKMMVHELKYDDSICQWIEEREQQLTLKNLRTWKSIRLKKLFM